VGEGKFWFGEDGEIVAGEMGILEFFDLRRMRPAKEMRVRPEMERRGRTEGWDSEGEELMPRD